MTENITIVGAGIGGLTTALVLKQKGLQASIYESAPEIKPVGAGIVMANNAMQVFRKLGIQNKIENAGHKVSSMKITDQQLNVISAMELSKYESKYGVHNVAIHRGNLQKILANEIGFENIRLSKRLLKIERVEKFNLTFDDDTTIESDIVIGADGIRSVVRNQLFEPGTIRDTQQKCWRGVCSIELSEKYDHEANEAWGKGKRFGFVKINSRDVYWYAVANHQMAKGNETDLLDLFKEFHADILEIISCTPKDRIFFSDIIDLKPISKWQDKNVCLIGDAAHATTPNLGQGACQAVEDSYTLGQLLDSGKSLANTFIQYEALRVNKAHNIVNRSRTIGKVAHWENSAGIWLRNMLIKNLPPSANEKQLDEIFDISYV